MGGEVYPDLQKSIFDANYPAGTVNHQDFLLCVNTTHTSWMLNYYAFESPGYIGAALTKAKTASNRMGYSFRVKKVTATTGATSGKIDITVQIVQVGVAPFYYPLSLILSCNNGKEQYSTSGLETALVNEGVAVDFTVYGVSSAPACVSRITILLSSSRLRTGQYQLQLKKKASQCVMSATCYSLPILGLCSLNTA